MEKKSYVINKIALVVLCVLSLAMIAANVVNLINGKMPKGIFSIASIIIYLAIIYYALFAYKRPHGNELKITMLVCMVFTLMRTMLVSVVNNDEINVVFTIQLATMFIAVILMSYVAGRLDRIKENKIILSIALVLIIAGTVCLFVKPEAAPQAVEGAEAAIEPIKIEEWKIFVGNMPRFDTLIQFVTLMAAYLSRYTLHKEAGLKDK